jgi:hypothetical protein
LYKKVKNEIKTKQKKNYAKMIIKKRRRRRMNRNGMIKTRLSQAAD